MKIKIKKWNKKTIIIICLVLVLLASGLFIAFKSRYQAASKVGMMPLEGMIVFDKKTNTYMPVREYVSKLIPCITKNTCKNTNKMGALSLKNINYKDGAGNTMIGDLYYSYMQAKEDTTTQKIFYIGRLGGGNNTFDFKSIKTNKIKIASNVFVANDPSATYSEYNTSDAWGYRSKYYNLTGDVCNNNSSCIKQIKTVKSGTIYDINFYKRKGKIAVSKGTIVKQGKTSYLYVVEGEITLTK